MRCPSCKVDLNQQDHLQECVLDISIIPRELRRVSEESPALKFDSDKALQPELIAPEMIFSLSEVLAYGAKKYAPRNWEKGMDWSRCFGALMRHMWAWWRGEDRDPETGFSHLAHAACCLMFLIAYESRKVGNDNRYILKEKV